MAEPTAVSLFSGIGGLDLGVVAAGYRIVFAADVDSDAVSVYLASAVSAAHCQRAWTLRSFCEKQFRFALKALVPRGAPRR